MDDTLERDEAAKDESAEGPENAGASAEGVDADAATEGAAVEDASTGAADGNAEDACAAAEGAPAKSESVAAEVAASEAEGAADTGETVDAGGAAVEHDDAEQDAREAEDTSGASADASPSDGGAVAQTADDPGSGGAVAQTADDANEPKPADFDLLGAARSVTEAGGRSVTDGISAMREVSRAKRAHAKARDALAELEQRAQAEAEELAHRRDVEHNYDKIVEAQRAEIADAAADGERARKEQASLEARRDEAKARLKRLKGDNDRRISPYKELAENAKGTLDDAERAWSEARRGLRLAQAQADDAANSRDSRLAAANRAADNAAERLARLQDQLAQMRRDPRAGSKEISEMSGGVAAALAQLENAREDVVRVTAETSRAVEIAQTHLYTQRTSLEEAEADLEAARADEQEKREAHRRLRDEADDAERELSKAVSELSGQIENARQTQETAQARAEAAQAAIDEADDIHAHPEVTLALERQAQQSREAAEAQHQQVGVLADEERAVRERTRRTRRTFVAVVAAAVALLALVVWLVTR